VERGIHRDLKPENMLLRRRSGHLERKATPSRPPSTTRWIRASKDPLDVPEELEVVGDLGDPAEDPLPLGDQGLPYALEPPNQVPGIHVHAPCSTMVPRVKAVPDRRL
jgi:hypothetical protein